MRFMSIYRAEETGAQPCPEELPAMGDLIAEMTRSGVLLATGGCLPSAQGARVRSTQGKLTVTDGPFTETKEIIAGFAMIECESKAQAVELARRFLAAAGGDGEAEVRQMADF